MAATLVMVYHLGHKDLGVGFVKQILNHGYLWVDQFFILSGFIMALTYAGEFSSGLNWTHYKTFIARRLARVYPLYLSFTLLWVALIESGKVHDLRPEPFWPTVIANLFLVQSWLVSASIVLPAWSISTEFTAYLAFPWLTRWTLFGGKRLASACVAISLAALVGVALLPDRMVTIPEFGRTGPLDVFYGVSLGPLLRCLAEFTFGLVAFRVERSLSNSVRGWLTRWDAAIGALLLGLMALPGGDLPAVATMPVLVAALASDRGTLSRLLGSGAVYRVGVWSFALYLVHLRFSRSTAILLEKLTEHHVPFPGPISVAVAGTAALAVAAIAHFVIEKPGRRLVRRLTGAA